MEWQNETYTQTYGGLQSLRGRSGRSISLNSH
jgi:hypothetical protein